MKYYAHYNDKNSKLLGFYTDGIHTEIPKPNIELTKKQWQEALVNGYNAVVNGNLIKKDFRTIEEIKSQRYKALEQIFSEKWLGIQKLIIDKPYMTNPKTIQAQIDSYKELAIVAKDKLQQDPNNAELQAIVNKYNYALNMQFEANKAMQTIRGLLEDKIANNDPNIDNLLEIANNIKLSKDELTEQKLTELISLFT